MNDSTSYVYAYDGTPGAELTLAYLVTRAVNARQVLPVVAMSPEAMVTLKASVDRMTPWCQRAIQMHMDPPMYLTPEITAACSESLRLRKLPAYTTLYWDGPWGRITAFIRLTRPPKRIVLNANDVAPRYVLAALRDHGVEILIYANDSLADAGVRYKPRCSYSELLRDAFDQRVATDLEEALIAHERNSNEYDQLLCDKLQGVTTDSLTGESIETLIELVVTDLEKGQIRIAELESDALMSFAVHPVTGVIADLLGEQFELAWVAGVAHMDKLGAAFEQDRDGRHKYLMCVDGYQKEARRVIINELDRVFCCDQW